MASANALLLFVLLFFRKKNPLPNKSLSITMLVLAMYFANSLLMFEGITEKAPVILFVVQIAAVLYAPAISIYVFALLGKPMRKLIPVFVASFVIGLMPVYFWFEFSQWAAPLKISFFSGLIHGPYPSEVTTYSLVFYSFQQVVFIFLFATILKIKRKAKGYYSDFDVSKLNYLHHLMLMLVMLNFLIVLLYSIFDILFVEYVLLPLIVTAIYTFIVFYAFKNNAIFTSEQYRIHLKTTDAFELFSQQKKVKTETSSLIDKTLLAKVLHQDKLLKDPHLTVGKLASAMNLQPAQLSKAINEELQLSFFDLVNSERIKEAKKRLATDRNFTIEGIGFDVGFNSRASFYRAFKKYTNQTPSEYIKAFTQVETD